MKILKLIFLTLCSLIFLTQTAWAQYQYLGHSADNDDRNGWFNETQGIANGAPSVGDPYWFFSKNIDDKNSRSTYIYKVSYTQHLAHNFDIIRRRIRLPGGSHVCAHVGDIDYHVYRRTGYVVAGYDHCGDGIARIAFFRAKDINGRSEVLAPWTVIKVNALQYDGAPWVAVQNDGRIYSSRGGGHAANKIFEYTLDWSKVHAGINPSFSSRTLSLMDTQGRAVNLPYKQGADISSDGKTFIFSTGYEDKVFKGLWVFNIERDRLVFVNKSSNSQMPFKFQTGGYADFKQEPQGVSYFDVNNISPYHKSMKRGELHTILLNNNLGDDSIWIKHYTQIDSLRPPRRAQRRVPERVKKRRNEKIIIRRKVK